MNLSIKPLGGICIQILGVYWSVCIVWNYYLMFCIPCLRHYPPIIYILGSGKLKNQPVPHPFSRLQRGGVVDIWGTSFSFKKKLRYNLHILKFTLVLGVYMVLWVLTNTYNCVITTVPAQSRKRTFPSRSNLLQAPFIVGPCHPQPLATTYPCYFPIVLTFLECRIHVIMWGKSMSLTLFI